MTSAAAHPSSTSKSVHSSASLIDVELTLQLHGALVIPSSLCSSLSLLPGGAACVIFRQMQQQRSLAVAAVCSVCPIFPSDRRSYPAIVNTKRGLSASVSTQSQLPLDCPSSMNSPFRPLPLGSFSSCVRAMALPLPCSTQPLIEVTLNVATIPPATQRLACKCVPNVPRLSTVPSSYCRDAAVGLVVVSGSWLTLPFNTIARVSMPAVHHHRLGSLSQPAPNPDLPSELQNVLASYIGCETRILWKIHEEINEYSDSASPVVNESPRSASSTPFASALSSSNKTSSPFAVALGFPGTPLNSVVSPKLLLRTPAARDAPSSVDHLPAAPSQLPLTLQVELALDKMKSSRSPRLHVSGLEREARMLLEHLCSQNLQRDADTIVGRNSTVRPLIILYGCEGCGKRSLVRSAFAAVDPPFLISELDCTFLSTSADTMQRSIECFFASAACSNAAVLLTGIQDALSTRKFSSASAARFVSLLIHLLMERQRNHSVQRLYSPCVISCSSPEFLDLHLRSFAQLELAVPSPSTQDRAAITALHLEHALHPAISGTIASEVQKGGKYAHALSLTSETMTGFSGTDCVQVANHTARRLNAHISTVAVQFESQLVHDALMDAVATCRPAAAPSRIGVKVLNSAPSSAYCSPLGGLDHVTDALEQAIIWPTKRADDMRFMCVRPARGVLLHGPPGCGKTSVVRALAVRHGTALLISSAAEIFSCYVGEAEAIVRSLFARARACSPCVLFIDEIDALVGSRSFGGSGESGGDVVQGRVLASFLTEMDGIGASDAGVVLVGATNRLESSHNLFSQLTRVSASMRHFFDLVALISKFVQPLVAVPPPTLAQRASILSAVASEMQLAENLDVSSLAASTEGWSGAEVAAILRDAAAAAIRENADAQCIETRHVRIAR